MSPISSSSSVPPASRIAHRTPPTHQATDADHGRVEIRRHWITSDIGWLRERHPAWAGLTSIGMIEAERQEPGKPATRQTRFYIASTPPIPSSSPALPASIGASRTAFIGVLDVILREDAYRIRKRNGPANFATIRHMTLNLLQRAKTARKKSVRVKRGLALNETFLQPSSWQAVQAIPLTPAGELLDTPRVPR